MFGSSYNTTTQQDVAIIKTDSLGNLLWAKTYGGASTDGAISAVVTADSNYMVVGLKDASIDNSIWLLKINDNGDTLWTKTITLGQGNNSPAEIEKTYDGGYILTGHCTPRSVGALDVYLIKLDSNGDTLWAKTYGGLDSDIGSSVKQTIDSGYVIVGATNNFGPSPSYIYIIKTNSQGDTIWTKTMGHNSLDIANSIQQTQDSGYIISGYSWSDLTNNYDVYLIKLNAFGDSIWSKDIGDQLENTSENIQITSDGGYVLAGTTWTTNSNYDVFLIRTDSNGDTLWTKNIGGNSTEHGYFIQETSDGGFVLTGSSDTDTPNSVYLVKTDNLGNLTTGIKDLENTQGYSIFPIPAKQTVYVNSLVIEGNRNVNYCLVDVYGKKLIQGEIEIGEVVGEINLNGLKSGIYFIVFTEKGKRTLINKIIVQY